MGNDYREREKRRTHTMQTICKCCGFCFMWIKRGMRNGGAICSLILPYSPCSVSQFLCQMEIIGRSIIAGKKMFPPEMIPSQVMMTMGIQLNSPVGTKNLKREEIEGYSLGANINLLCHPSRLLIHFYSIHCTKQKKKIHIFIINYFD